MLLVSLMLPNVAWLVAQIAMDGDGTVSATPAALLTVGESVAAAAWRQTGILWVIWLIFLAIGIWTLFARPARVLAVARRLERL